MWRMRWPDAPSRASGVRRCKHIEGKALTGSTWRDQHKLECLVEYGLRPPMTGRLSLTERKCSQMVDDGAAAAAALEAQRWGEAKRAALAEAQAVGEAALQQAASALVG